MKISKEDQIKFLILALVSIIALIAIIIAYMVFDEEYFSVNNHNSIIQSSSKDQKIGDLLLEQDKIIYFAGTVKVTSKVTNVGTTKDNLRFKVKFISYDGKTMGETIGYVGQIKPNETKYVDSFIKLDTTDSKEITYELIQ
jgi:hypothetical protein